MVEALNRTLHGRERARISFPGANGLPHHIPPPPALEIAVNLGFTVASPRLDPGLMRPPLLQAAHSNRLLHAGGHSIRGHRSLTIICSENTNSNYSSRRDFHFGHDHGLRRDARDQSVAGLGGANLGQLRWRSGSAVKKNFVPGTSADLSGPPLEPALYIGYQTKQLRKSSPRRTGTTPAVLLSVRVNMTGRPFS